VCEFYLKGNCFHPEKVGKGTIANSCDVHSCNDCTNRVWQTSMINKDINYHQTLLNLALKHQEEHTIKEIQTTQIGVQKENRFKSPFEKFIGKKSEVGRLQP
jgi:hypothetical protein